MCSRSGLCVLSLQVGFVHCVFSSPPCARLPLSPHPPRLAEELEQDDHYHMPSGYEDDKGGRDKKYEVLTQRYRDVDEEEKAETPWAQQEAFEAEQIRRAAGAGAKERKAKAAAGG